MNLPSKLVLVFVTIIVLSVGSSLIALREINSLEVSIKNDIKVIVPVRAALLAVGDRAVGLRSARLILMPEQSFAECWAKLEQYKAQYSDFLALQASLNNLLNAENLPLTHELWRAQAPRLKTWKILFGQLDSLFQQWFASGIANPDQLYMQLEGFEREQSDMLADVHKKVLQGDALAAVAQTIPEDGGPLQLELDHFRESRALFKDGIWDGVRPYTLADGSPADTTAKNDVLAARLAQVGEIYTSYRQALDKAKEAMRQGAREAALAALGQCLVLNGDMVEHLHAMHDEARRMQTLKQELQKVGQQMEETRVAFQNAMDEIIVANDEELYSQSNSAVASVERTKSLLWILLGVFMALSVLLGVYTLFEYRRSRATLREVQRARESAYAEMHFLFNTFPMGCLMRDADFRLMSCNMAAAKLFGIEEQWNEMEENAQAFGLKDKWEYLERYAALVYPEFQPDGEPSREKAQRLFKQALEEGRVQTEWMYQMADGSPLPAEVILQRADWGGWPAVVYHIRDLRGEKGSKPQGGQSEKEGQTGQVGPAGQNSQSGQA